MIPGFHAVKESLLYGANRIHEIWIVEGKSGGRSDEVLRLAKEKGIRLFIKSRDDIERLAPGINHQGIVAFAEEFVYLDLANLLSRTWNVQGFRLLLATDHITDEGNLGALMRTAAFFSVQGLILPKDRSARVTGSLVKRTSGAYVSLPVAQVVNLRRALDVLRGKGFWIIGAAAEALKSIYDFDWRRHTVLVLGSENKGLSRSVRKGCDATVRIPGEGTVESLNVSVAGGIILAEINRQRQRENP